MYRCHTCGRRFRLLAKNRYEIMKSPVGINCLVEGVVYYNAFDCPYCGCQNITGVLEKVNVKDFESDISGKENDLVDYPDTMPNQFDNMTGSMNL